MPNAVPKATEFNPASHHAFYLIGGDSVRDQLITALTENKELPASNDPDFFEKRYETLNIADARELTLLHGTRPTGDKNKKVFLLIMDGITLEAQNALLKLLEEPAEYAHFFLIIPSAHLFLPTVKSRISLLNLGELNQTSIELTEQAEAFIKMSAPKRIEAIKSLLDDIAKEKKRKQDAILFLDALEAIVYKNKGIKDGRSLLESIAFAKKYANDRAPSLKMLIESVALS